MTSANDIKRMAESIRKCSTGEHYYDKKYGDLKVADLLLVLEDENYHSEETIIEALVSLDYEAIKEAVSIANGHFADGQLTQPLYERRRELDKKLRERK